MSSNASMLRQMSPEAGNHRKKVLFHLVQKSVWDEFRNGPADTYEPPTFEKDGRYVQAAQEHEVLLDVANRFYKGVQADFLLVIIDCQHRRLRGKVRYDGDDVTHIFPQIHSAIPVEAILGQHLVERSADGYFLGLASAQEWQLDLERACSVPLRPNLPPPTRRNSEHGNLSFMCIPLANGCDNGCYSQTNRPTEFQPGDYPESSSTRRIVSVGEDERQMDVRLFTAGTPNKAVLVFPGMKGVTAILERRCDDLASTVGDAVVVLPDFYRGKSWQKPTDFSSKSALTEFEAWARLFPWATIQSDVYTLLLPLLAEAGLPPGVQLAAVGFSFGSYATLKCCADPDVFRCGVLCHPSLQMAETVYGEALVQVLEDTRVPQLVLTAGNDTASMKQGGVGQQVLSRAPETSESQFHENQCLAHGAFLEEDAPLEIQIHVHEHATQIAQFITTFLQPPPPPPEESPLSDGDGALVNEQPGTSGSVPAPVPVA